MLQLFVPPTPFKDWGEHAFDGTSQRQLIAVLIVSVGALALILCVALLSIFSGEPLGPPDQSRFPESQRLACSQERLVPDLCVLGVSGKSAMLAA